MLSKPLLLNSFVEVGLSLKRSQKNPAPRAHFTQNDTDVDIAAHFPPLLHSPVSRCSELETSFKRFLKPSDFGIPDLFGDITDRDFGMG
jgi:hypothetical protein